MPGEKSGYCIFKPCKFPGFLMIRMAQMAGGQKAGWGGGRMGQL